MRMFSYIAKKMKVIQRQSWHHMCVTIVVTCPLFGLPTYCKSNWNTYLQKDCWYDRWDSTLRNCSSLVEWQVAVSPGVSGFSVVLWTNLLPRQVHNRIRILLRPVLISLLHAAHQFLSSTTNWLVSMGDALSCSGRLMIENVISQWT